MEKLMLKDLLSQAEEKLRKEKYTEETIKDYKYVWNKFYNMCELFNVNYFDLNLAMNFLEKYYELLCRKIEKIADSMINLYSPKISKEELIDEGINCVLDHGKTEKNLAFDESKIIGKLLFKARYKMLKSVINSYNKINLDDVIEFIKIENNMNQTNKIERWLYPIKLKRIEKLIIDTIQLNIESVIKNIAQGLNEINKKLNIEYEKFYKNIEEIAQKLINQNKVRLCSDGKVVIINE